MTALFFKYYFDVTKYNILFSLLVTFLSQNLYAGSISFGTIGMMVSLLIYRYYHNIEYYFYLNAGLSKRGIIVKSLKINFVVSVIFSTILWCIH